MNPNNVSAGVVTPVKNSKLIRSQSNGGGQQSRNSENLNPNTKSPGMKSSPLLKSATKSSSLKSDKSTPSKQPLSSPNLVIKERKPRKFLIAKKNLKNSKLDSSKSVVCNCDCDSKLNGVPFKCRCVAYESLRASQEEFFKNSNNDDTLSDANEKELKKSEDYQNLDSVIQSPDEKLGLNETRRESLGVVTGSGKVMQLIKAFENKLTLPNSEENDDDDERKDVKRKGERWDFTGIRSSLNLDTQVCLSSFCPSELVLTSESLGLSCSLDRSRESISSRSSSGERRSSRRNSAESSGRFSGRHRRNTRQLKATSQKPFKLRTEQRGRYKQEELVKKVHHMLEEEEKQRIPIAQGLPWTTDEPECLVKPPVKESTRPIDLVLHSDIRAEERAEFDHEVAEKMTLIEQYKMERERQQKLAEEEEIKRLRKELVPKAQPMPYFDRPLIPRRSEKNPTIPKEPKFHLPQHKKIKCSVSWSESSYTTELQ